MSDSDYLQLAKDNLDIGSNWNRDDKDRSQDVAEAQAAASIAVAERLGDLILVVALLAERLDDLSDLIFEMQQGAVAKR